MSTLPGLCEVDSESCDFIPGNLPLEEEYKNLDLADIISTIFGRRDTHDDSIYIDNINNVDKAFDNVFPFNKPTIELQENEESKIVLFKTKKLKKRGRKKPPNNIYNSNKPKRKIHCKTDDDNVLIKLQVHFLTFVINITNDIIDQYFQSKKYDIYFRQINYEDKKNITKPHISRLRDCSIKDILQMKITPKCRKYGEDYNKDNYKFILKQIDKDKSLNWINNFFNMNYLDLFEKYYYTFDKKSNFIIQDQKINFSRKSKTFYDLLEKNSDDQEIQKCLIKISQSYLDRVKQQSQKIFLIEKTQ